MPAGCSHLRVVFRIGAERHYYIAPLPPDPLEVRDNAFDISALPVWSGDFADGPAPVPDARNGRIRPEYESDAD